MALMVTWSQKPPNHLKRCSCLCYALFLPCQTLLVLAVGLLLPFAATTHASRAICRDVPSHASYSKASAKPNRHLPKDPAAKINSARRDAQAMANLLGNEGIISGALLTQHVPNAKPIKGCSTSITSVMPGAAQGESKPLAASPGQKPPKQKYSQHRHYVS